MATLKNAYRIEKDFLGRIRVPADAYYGAQTQRAIENFPISGWRFSKELIHAMGLIKYGAAKVNSDLGLLNRRIAGAIGKASDEVMRGRWDEEFVLDIFQTGSGTSTHMNVNEVIANRANEILGGRKGFYWPVHPNDHVNLGQSSNDVFPTAIHIAVMKLLRERLLPSLKDLHKALKDKGREFQSILKIGRTHLQDATPIGLGQEFSGYARQIELGIWRIHQAIPSLLELPLGGTAVGTGINTHPQFARRVISIINKKMKDRFREAVNHFEAQGSRDGAVELSGVLKTLAVSLIKIANDIRWMGSGPRCGIGELHLPETQPGSSIIPGKVNPVIPESLIQVCAQVIGNDSAITLGGLSGHFELNTSMPLIAFNLLESIRLLSNGIENFTNRCLKGLKADKQQCREMVEKSLALATVLTPKIGYEKASRIAKKAYEAKRAIREQVEEEGLFSKEELNQLFDLQSMASFLKSNKKRR